MNKLRLLATSLLVALGAGFSSCGDEDIIIPQDPDNVEEEEKNPLEDYLGKDYSNVKCFRFSQKGDTTVISGLKDKHLWFAYFDELNNKKKVFEWVDVEETDTIQQLYKGYGEYEKITIERVSSIYYKKTSTGNVVQFEYFGDNRGFQTIFTSDGKTKRTDIQEGLGVYSPKAWYNESFFIQNCCYSHEGDTIYVSKEEPPFYNNEQVELLSYEEGIRFYKSTYPYISRWNYKESKGLWYKTLDDLNVLENSKIDYIVVEKK